MPRVSARAIITKGEGTTGNRHHLNLTKPLSMLWELHEVASGPYKPQGKARAPVKVKSRPERLSGIIAAYDVPKREKQIFQLVLAGNHLDMVDLAMNLQPGEAKRVCERWGIEP